MFGFFIGTICLLGLIAVLRRGRRGCHGWHGGHHHRHHHRGGQRHMLRFLFERLDTTPGQEKEIRGAIDDLFEEGRGLRREGRSSRDDVAKLLRTESLDETILGELFARHDERLRDMQKAFADALGRIHQALDPEQRAQLASLLESDHGPGHGGPYRGWI